jgi:translocation and assembly module TamA
MPADPAATAEAASAAAEDDTVAYSVAIAPTGDDGLDRALAEASQLVALREVAPTTAEGLLARAAADRERLARVLHAEGYWAAAIRISVGGQALPAAGEPAAARVPGAPDAAPRPVADPGAPRPVADPRAAHRDADPGAAHRDADPGAAHRDADPGAATPPPEVAPGTVPVSIAIETRARFRIAHIAIQAADPAEAPAIAAAAAALGLAIGDPARAAPILAAERRLVEALRAAGHPLAAVVRRDAEVDYDTATMRLGWVLAPGPLARFGQPLVAGTQRVDAAFLGRFAARRLHGETFSPDRLERARRDLVALGVFDSVRADPATALDAAGRLPVTFTVAERPRRALGGSVAYETNFGPSVRLFWEHRNLFGRAERLRLEGEVSRIGTGGSLDQMTYRAFATLRDPAFAAGELTLVATLGALRERLDAYDRTAVVASALAERRLREGFAVLAGPVADLGEAGPPGGTLSPYQLLGVTFGGRLDTTDSLLDPARGWRVNGTLTPSYNLEDSQPLAPLRLTASTYWDLAGDRRGILALRGSFGSLLGVSADAVPPHIRFFAGGGGSVRGYDFQSIGPRDPRTDKPAGGASVMEASIEWRQRLWGDVGMVAFADAGAVATRSTPDLSEIRVGVGLGLRYYTAIGPIRADVALPLIRQDGSSGYGLYVGIGQSF